MAPTLVPVIILCFQVIGLFGNINLIVATLRTKSFHTKHGVLLALTTLYQSFCLLGELVTAIVGLYGITFHRHSCFALMLPYIIFSCMQSTMFFVLVLNKLLSVIFPMRVMVIELWAYVMMASTPPIIYAVFILIINVVMMFRGEENPVVKFCNPSFAMEPLASGVWILWNAFSNIMVLCMHISFYLVVRSKVATSAELRKNFVPPDEKRCILCLLILLTCFVCTWCTCMLSQAVVLWMQPSEATFAVQLYSVIFALMAYSMNFYVYFAKNHVYRKVFLEQLSCLVPTRYRSESSSDRSGSSQPSSRVTLPQDTSYREGSNLSTSKHLEQSILLHCRGAKVKKN
ncbi:hypothetical protein OSTOST_03522 [Ostertagia ostertagi]